jgi:ribose transport system substrate-binding protein
VLQSPRRLPEIAFIPRTSGTNFTEAMRRGASRAAGEAGFHLYWNAATREDDVDRQIWLMTRALENGTRGLILGPTNGSALTTTIDKFISRQIPIVVVQTATPIPHNAYITSITPDENEVSKLAADRILNVVGKEAEVAILGVDRAAPETVDRARNFVREMSEHRGIKIVAEHPGTSLLPEAEQNASEVIEMYPRLKAIFGLSATATEGAVLALQRRGLQRAIVLVGCDEDLFLMYELDAGKFDSLVVSDGELMGYLAAKSLIGALSGRPLPAPRSIGARLLVRGNGSTEASQ